MNITDFINWVKAKEGRGFQIQADNYCKEDYKFSVYVHDYTLGVGQFVNGVDEINLEGRKLRRDKEKFEQLRKQFA